MRRWGFAAFLALALGAGCDGEQTVDAGSDAGRLPDAGGDDAGGDDDAGMDDGGPLPGDAGSDAGMTDAGSLCGNGMVDGTEECDGTMFGGASCATLLGAGATGALACNGCTIDSSACELCGDGAITGTEACDGTNLGTATCASMGFTSGALACSVCTFDSSGCSAVAPVTTAGQIVITEIMKNPATYSDTDGEWFEIHNPGGADLNLQGCVIGDTIDTFTIATNVVVAAGGYATFSPETTDAEAPGFTPSFRWPGNFAMANSMPDVINIVCGGTTIDSVTWDVGVTFPDPTGESMTLDLRTLNATDNDIGSNWCTGLSTIGTTTDLGTPGTANDPCQTYPIGFCRLQFPVSIMGMGTESTDVFGRVYVAGLTDRTGTNDPYPRLRAQVGYGPDGSDPATDARWTWSDAAPNAAYGPGSPSYEGNNDEYLGSLSSPSASGAYDFAYRFSGDTGTTWTVCDSLAAGSSDGYDPANAGSISIVAPPPTITAIAPGTIDVRTGSTGILVVTLSGPAPVGGYPIAITSSVDTSLVVPVLLTIPEGATSAGFRVRGLVAGSSVVTATATLGGSMAMAVVNVITTAMVPGPGDIVINEILFDPPTATAAEPLRGDANCDGTRSASADEFLELVNVSARPLELDGVSIWDATSFNDTLMPARFVFSPFVLGPGEAVIVFGGGTGGTDTTQPWCGGATPTRIGDAATFASTGLSLDNAGDTVRITPIPNRATPVVAMEMWTSGTVAAAQSWALSPDLTGTRTAYTTAPGHATDRRLSPGTLLTGRPFAEASAP